MRQKQQQQLIGYNNNSKTKNLIKRQKNIAKRLSKS